MKHEGVYESVFVVQSFLKLLYKTEASGLLHVLVAPHRVSASCIRGIVWLGPRPGLVAIVNKYLYLLLESNPRFSGCPPRSLLAIINEIN